MSNVVELRPHLYEAKSFAAGQFVASGTLCGHIDLATPSGTYVLSPDEAQAVIVVLQNARADVLENSTPMHDPRLYSNSEETLAMHVDVNSDTWQHNCLRWRGEVLTGRHAHYCYEWDELPIDETTPEWPCGCSLMKHHGILNAKES